MGYVMGSYLGFAKDELESLFNEVLMEYLVDKAADEETIGEIRERYQGITHKLTALQKVEVLGTRMRLHLQNKDADLMMIIQGVADLE